MIVRRVALVGADYSSVLVRAIDKILGTHNLGSPAFGVAQLRNPGHDPLSGLTAAPWARPLTRECSAAFAENCIHAGEVHDIYQSQARVSVALDRTVTAAAGGRRGMMCGCAVATGLLDCGERVRGAASSSHE
jgi:hypothetical protein